MLVALVELFGEAFLLGHAAAHAHQQLGLFLLDFLGEDDVAHGAALGVVADAAGVEEDEVGLLLFFFHRHAHAAQDAAQGLAVVGVHLAAVGDDVVDLGAVGAAFDLPGDALLAQDFLPVHRSHCVTHGVLQSPRLCCSQAAGLSA